MKSSIEKMKFRNPASTLDLASSAFRAQRPRDGSMQMSTYSTGPCGSRLGKKTSPSASASAFIRRSSALYVRMGAAVYPNQYPGQDIEPDPAGRGGAPEDVARPAGALGRASIGSPQL